MQACIAARAGTVCDELREVCEQKSTTRLLAVAARQLECTKEKLKMLPRSAIRLQMNDEQLDAWAVSKCMIVSTAAQLLLKQKEQTLHWKAKCVETSDAYVSKRVACGVRIKLALEWFYAGHLAQTHKSAHVGIEAPDQRPAAQERRASEADSPGC